MPQGTFDFQAATLPQTPTTRGGSRYVLVPPDWPTESQVRLLLHPLEAKP